MCQNLYAVCALYCRPSVLGPALPPGFKIQSDDEEGENDDSRGFLGPALPPDYKPDLSSSDEGDDDDDDDVIGPMPSKGAAQDSVALDFERRAQRMKDKLTGVDVNKKKIYLIKADLLILFYYSIINSIKDIVCPKIKILPIRYLSLCST